MDRRNFILNALNSIKIDENLKKTCKVIVIKNFVDEKIDKSISKIVSLNLYSNKLGLGQKIVELTEFVDEDEMIAFLEDDDLYFEEKINRIIEILSVNENIYFYHNAFISIDLNGKYLPIYKHNKKINCRIINSSTHSKQIFQVISNGGAHNLSSMVIRCGLIKTYMTLISKINYSLDHVLFLLSLESGHDMYFDNKVMTKYTIHNNSSRPSILENDYLEVKSIFIQKVKNELNHVIGALQHPTSLKIADYFIQEIRIHEWFVSLNQTPILPWRNLSSFAIMCVRNRDYILFSIIVVIAVGKVFRFSRKIKGKIYKIGASAF